MILLTISDVNMLYNIAFTTKIVLPLNIILPEIDKKTDIKCSCTRS